MKNIMLHDELEEKHEPAPQSIVIFFDCIQLIVTFHLNVL